MATSAHSQQQEEASLLRSDADGVAKLTLNRPRAGNSLSRGLMAALQAELDDISADADVRVVVIAATGEIFSAGHDLKEIRANPGRAAYEALFGQCAALMTSIVKLPQPVIARVQGVATAAGCQLVASCELAIAAKEAKFATPGVNIGLFCSTPMVALARNIGRKQAMEMLLTGEAIDAGRAEQYGLINRSVESLALDDEIAGLTETIKGKSPITIAIGKEAFYRQLDMDLPEAYAYVSEVMTRNMLPRDAGEGIDAFLEKRPPEWEGR